MKRKIVLSNYVILSTDIQFVIMYLLEKIYINKISSFLSGCLIITVKLLLAYSGVASSWFKSKNVKILKASQQFSNYKVIQVGNWSMALYRIGVFRLLTAHTNLLPVIDDIDFYCLIINLIFLFLTRKYYIN